MMVAMRVLMGTDELLAHALAIECEAAERYEELGQRMKDLGNDAVADLFLGLADNEHEHEKHLKRRAAGLPLPSLDRGRYAWIAEDDAPETAARSLVLGMMTPHAALKIALGLSLLGWIMWRVMKGKYTAEYYVPVELGALYWHLVDLVWIFL